MTGSGTGETLESSLKYRFNDPLLLQAALTHRSHAHENQAEPVEDNERLEFLGDAVLGLAAAHHLFLLFPDAREGELSRLRATLVGEQGLSAAARTLGLGRHLRLGRGEESSGGSEKDSILSGALEALLGAVFVDGGWTAACEVARPLFAETLERTGAAGSAADPKTRLQEICQSRFRLTPRYRLTARSGPEHRPHFSVEVLLGEEVLAEGRGRSKKAAEQAAAAAAAEHLDSSAGSGK